VQWSCWDWVFGPTTPVRQTDYAQSADEEEHSIIRHIVMWKFRPGTEAEQNQFLTELQALYGVIPQLKECEVAVNVGEGNYDAVLVSVFENLEDLETYKTDPRHKAVSQLCKSIREDRVAVDYEF